MPTGRSSEQPVGGAGPSGATEPITLTDPDGAVTLVAPWSTWTREQVRAPGGEPALVTRLDQGQLWFSAGRRRSPWRHEIHIGTVVVTTPVGRFHVTAEPDGGATIDCLAGRTRVAGPHHATVVLEADQTAAVASDGETLVLLDRPPAVGATPEAVAAPVAEPARPRAAAPLAEPEPPVAPSRSWRRRLPEAVAIAALLGVLVAAVIVFGRNGDDGRTVASPGTTSAPIVSAPSTTAEPTTAAPTTAATTTAAPTTAAPTTAPPTTASPTTSLTTTLPTATAPGSASGTLASCRRAEGGVLATIAVSLESGGPARFTVGVGLVDDAGQVFAQGEAATPVISRRGAPQPVDVLVEVAGDVNGVCELLGVENI